ncbi:hypothetical protein [Paenibacillus radicis (ex Gao et al. 2016)]|uniref:SbsA Ig-like domain-containing protein n=1 Tax=Paenibacillus radicis (ex Gao et al. 2016) TaxID=1737354 RepID=A0A917GRN3_9BACL|nr:hypothetical protein [Paenibacillus radicis (ex Gao et al. 2016)]GGG54390.1 hypothetical protein GCM10010918_04020 [Paenibacillus radicis (ex Gao et al. 2016)]
MKTYLLRLVICAFALLPLTMMGNDQAEAAVTEAAPVSNIPMVTGVNQIAANQLRVTYDQPVDQVKGINPNNYWIQSTTEQTPTNIATLGMNDSVNANNALTAEKVQIQASGNNGQDFILTFNQNIARGMAFKLIICYVTKPGAPPYSGDNGSISFVGLQ